MAKADALKMVTVDVLAPVYLAGREHSKEAPAIFEKGAVATIDEETAKASPWAFKIRTTETGN